jgi:hypothetical protein
MQLVRPIGLALSEPLLVRLDAIARAERVSRSKIASSFLLRGLVAYERGVARPRRSRTMPTPRCVHGGPEFRPSGATISLFRVRNRRDHRNCVASREGGRALANPYSEAPSFFGGDPTLGASPRPREAPHPPPKAAKRRLLRGRRLCAAGPANGRRKAALRSSRPLTAR